MAALSNKKHLQMTMAGMRCFVENKGAHSNTNTETACLKLIFTKFACSIKKVSVCHTGMYRHKKAVQV